MSSDSSLLKKIKEGAIKEDKTRVVVYLKTQPYQELMQIIHDKNKRVSQRVAFSNLLDVIIDGILKDKITIEEK